MKIKNHNTAGCFLIRKYNNQWEIVLIYKKWAKDNQGWVPPKGHVEEGETLEKAAIRETTEETGYTNMKIIMPLKTLHLEYPWEDGFIHKKDIHYFLAILIDNNRINLKQSKQEQESTVKITWLKLETAERKLKFDDEREILKKIQKIIKKIDDDKTIEKFKAN